MKNNETKQKYYLVYQINNKLNNKIYIGCHVTENIKDKYMGSGTLIRKAIKQYGMENFDKSILYCFNNEREMLDKEAELVNREFIAQDTNYNIIIGGGSFLTLDTISVKDKEGNCFRVHKTDPRWLSGELVSVSKNIVTVKDKFGNHSCVYLDDERYLSGELNFMWKDRKHNQEAKDKIGKANSLNQRGINNSNYDKCWINKNGISKCIKNDELDQYLALDWFIG